MMKKRIICVALVMVFAFLLVGCGSEGVNAGGKLEKEKYKIVCTIFPEYDWVKEILGDKASLYELTLLLDNGVDLHNYQPTVDDIAKISTCDLFIYVGGESDKWVDDVLKEASNTKMQVINLLECLGEAVKEEEVIEGMEGEEDEEDSEEEEIEYDEHVWLSLKNANSLVDVITETICKIDAENSEAYKSNRDEYKNKLIDLDERYKKVVDAANIKTVLFADRFPFRYMVDDYGINYYAAFVGCSAETEASFDTIIFLAGKVDELNLKKILVTESSDKKIAETIVGNAKSDAIDIISMDSIQSTTASDIEQGETYIKIMENNLKVLEEALN